MTERTDERSQDQTGTAREQIPPKVDLVARLRAWSTGSIQTMAGESPFDFLARVADTLEASEARADIAEAEVAGLKARVAEVLEPFAEYAGDDWSDVDGGDTITTSVLNGYTIDATFDDLRRAAELHAAIRGEEK